MGTIFMDRKVIIAAMVVNPDNKTPHPVSPTASVMEALREEGVDTVFGYPGGAALNIYDETYKQSYFKHVLTRHDQAAVHAADGYARASGKVGVAFVTSGPGFTNAVTGLATAYSDSIPLILISGQVPTSLIGTDAFQEIDAVGISRPCVKHNFLVTEVDEIAPTIKKAFQIAQSGRPGPSWLDLPLDIQGSFIDDDLPGFKAHAQEEYADVEKAARHVLQKIGSAERPVLYAGNGIRLAGAASLVDELARRLSVPVVTCWDSIDLIATEHPYYCGRGGTMGDRAGNFAVQNSDLLLSIGSRPRIL